MDDEKKGRGKLVHEHTCRGSVPLTREKVNFIIV